MSNRNEFHARNAAIDDTSGRYSRTATIAQPGLRPRVTVASRRADGAGEAFHIDTYTGRSVADCLEWCATNHPAATVINTLDAPRRATPAEIDAIYREAMARS